jgi:hypothetical protein
VSHALLRKADCPVAIVRLDRPVGADVSMRVDHYAGGRTTSRVATRSLRWRQRQSTPERLQDRGRFTPHRLVAREAKLYRLPSPDKWQPVVAV